MSQFIFWGLFVALGLVVTAYATWMVWIERTEQRTPRDDGHSGP